MVIRSEPTDYPWLDLAAEWGQVEEALGDLTDSGMVTFTVLAAPTLSELRRVSLREQFQVLHYMGHSGFEAEAGGMLLFTDQAGRSVPVTGEQLSVMFRDHTSLRLAVLNDCEAGRTDPTDPFGGIADTLVRRGIPAVIAMQFEVTDVAAIEFAPALYGALVAGRPIDVAAEARKAMYAVSPLEWATPVLHLRADDALLFDVSQQTPKVNHTTEGDRHLRERRYPEAETAYRRAIAADPRSAPAHVGLASALDGLNRMSEAEDACRQAIRLEPTSASAHTVLGTVLNGRKRYMEAEAACREAIRLDPRHAPAHAEPGAIQSARTVRFPKLTVEPKGELTEA